MAFVSGRAAATAVVAAPGSALEGPDLVSEDSGVLPVGSWLLCS